MAPNTGGVLELSMKQLKTRTRADIENQSLVWGSVSEPTEGQFKNILQMILILSQSGEVPLPR